MLEHGSPCSSKCLSLLVASGAPRYRHDIGASWQGKACWVVTILALVHLIGDEALVDIGDQS